MGIFDFVKSKRVKKQESIEDSSQMSEQTFSMPTIKPEKELFEYYDEVFNSIIKEITELTTDETKEILSIIKKCEGGFLNMGGYYSIIWGKYFKRKRWIWNEYEEWNNTFRKLGKFPSRFPRKSNFVPVTIEETLSKLKVSDLKSICIDNKVYATAKAKKKELIDVLKILPNISDSPVVVENVDKMNSKFEYELYSLLMRTINFRAKCLYDTRRAEKLGIKKFSVIHVFEEDKEFVELALKKKPNALHPVFPSDMSIKQSVIDF